MTCAAYIAPRLVESGGLTIKLTLADIRRVECSMFKLRLAGVARGVTIVKDHERETV
jgi:hypothetical protein